MTVALPGMSPSTHPYISRLLLGLHDRPITIRLGRTKTRAKCASQNTVSYRGPRDDQIGGLS